MRYQKYINVTGWLFSEVKGCFIYIYKYGSERGLWNTQTAHAPLWCTIYEKFCNMTYDPS